MNDKANVFDFYKALTKHLANVSIGVSTVRGYPTGTGKCVREYLGGMDFNQFRLIMNEADYSNIIDEHTKNLVDKLYLIIDHSKEKTALWGIARKCLNIFMRNACYNRFIYEKYQLSHLMPFLEVPLDSYVGKKLDSHNKNTKWTTITAINKVTNDNYQSVATDMAKNEYSFNHRIHLDLIAWRAED